jgi:hypothetical protein
MLIIKACFPVTIRSLSLVRPSSCLIYASSTETPLNIIQRGRLSLAVAPNARHALFLSLTSVDCFAALANGARTTAA